MHFVLIKNWIAVENQIIFMFLWFSLLLSIPPKSKIATKYEAKNKIIPKKENSQRERII